jgi:hypothetical protein
MSSIICRKCGFECEDKYAFFNHHKNSHKGKDRFGRKLTKDYCVKCNLRNPPKEHFKSKEHLLNFCTICKFSTLESNIFTEHYKWDRHIYGDYYKIDKHWAYYASFVNKAFLVISSNINNPLTGKKLKLNQIHKLLYSFASIGIYIKLEVREWDKIKEMKNKILKKFYCDICEYNAPNYYSLDRHFKTKKHIDCGQ